jgi:hypothetical protein
MVSTVLAPAVECDLALGGRWTSLRLGGREWLWSRRGVDRAGVRPGDAFVDAGGLEECVPTVRGRPDHGAAWSQPWHAEDGGAVVECDDFRLYRRVMATDRVVADYRLTAAPGYRFVWAAHALLDLGVGARIELPAGLAVRSYPDATGPYVSGVLDESFTELGPDDGTAVGAVVVGATGVGVVDGADRLQLRIEAAAGIPVSVALWRNLGGFPADDPYRSVGVEPMLGSVFDLAEAGPDDAVTVPASGLVAWRLVVSAA